MEKYVEREIALSLKIEVTISARVVRTVSHSDFSIFDLGTSLEVRNGIRKLSQIYPSSRLEECDSQTIVFHLTKKE